MEEILVALCSVCQAPIHRISGSRGPLKTICSEKCRNTRDWKKKVENKETEQRICFFCGKTFPIIKGGLKRRFCSKECEEKRKGTQAKSCLVCGNKFQINGSENQKKYCSRKCKIKVCRKPRKAFSKCEHCGKEFHAMSASRRFCSRKCSLDIRFLRSRLINAARICKDKLEQFNNECMICGKPTKNKWCSKECLLKHGKINSRARLAEKKEVKKVTCKHCHKEFSIIYGDKRKVFCSRKCCQAQKYPEHRQKYKKRLKGKFVCFINRLEIAKRDGWKCGICGSKIVKRYKWPSQKSLTLDHIIPLAKGGMHELKNVQAAHFICNSRKRDLPIPDQLRIF